jgi:hypothetical protein
VTGQPEVTVSVTVTLADLLNMAVVHVDGYGEMTTAAVGELVAARLAAEAGVTDLRAAIWARVQEEVARVVAAAADAKPTADGNLASMIMAEAVGQLARDVARGYAGTATPLRQWVAAEVYRQLREPAMNAISRATEAVDETVGEALRAWIDEKFPQ